MTEKITRLPISQRLKGLDEFEAPEFVGRMARVRRGRAMTWWSMVAAAALIGGVTGWLLF